MKLTKTLREAFVKAVMADVPSIDYNEMAAKEVRAAAEAVFQQKHPGASYEKLCAEGWLAGTYTYLPGTLANVYAYVGSAGHNWVSDRPELRERLVALEVLHREQADAHEKLREKLAAVAAACTTREALAKALPEFEKYLPVQPAKTAGVPALANLVTDFVAAGWPKEQPA